MINFKNSFHCVLHTFRAWKFNPQIISAFIVQIILLQIILSPISKFSASVQEPVAPWIFPFLSSDYYVILIIMFGALLLFCNAPFIGPQTRFMLVRCGKTPWICGQVLYVLLASLVYVSLIHIISILLLLPDMQWTNTWGKIYYTLAASNAGQVYNVPLSFSYNIILAYSPIAATAISMCLTWLVCSFIGVLILALNLFKRKSGVFIAAGFILLEVIALNSAFSTTYFSPVSWCSLACLSITGYSQYPSVVYAFSVLLVSILGLALFSILIIYKNKGYITKEEL